MKKHVWLPCLFVMLCSIASAQADTTKISVKLSLNYNSNLNYFGRTDNPVSSGIFPMAEVWLPSGWYLNVSPVFVHNSSQPLSYAGTIATLGLQKVTDVWIRNYYLLKPIYTKDAQLVQSALKLQTGVSFSYLNRIANLTLGADLKFSDKADLGATAGIDHLLYLAPNTINLVADPSLYLYAGTQQFSNTYTAKKNRGVVSPGAQPSGAKSSSRFAVLAYELSVPLIYTRSRMQYTASPAYIMPRSLIIVEGRPDLSEQGKNTLYLTLGAKFTF